MPANAPKLTPAMQQFHRFKKQHPHCVLFFRMGDFYELFYDDAKLAHKVLGVTLTQRTEGVPMAGVPYHAVEGYLRRMIQAGYRVAVCEQIEDPKEAKGVVQRDVTRVITPGTLTDEHLLDDASENPLAAVVFVDDATVALAWAELSTGSFHVGAFRRDEALDELARIAPRELLFCETADGRTPARIETLARSINCALTPRPGWQFRAAEATEVLKRQFEVAQLAGFGLANDDPSLMPAGGIVHYLIETQRADPAARFAHLQPPRKFERSNHLVIDQTTLASLEVERTLRTGSTDGSLLGALQHCTTAMGKRLMRHWLCYPLRDRAAIETRQRIVETFVQDGRFMRELTAAFEEVQDIPRIAGRLAVNRATPRDMVGLGASVSPIARLYELCQGVPSLQPYHAALRELVDDLSQLSQTIEQACVDAPPAHLREGGLFQDGFDQQLDEFRSLQRDSHEWLARYQKQLAEQTGIASLKVGYNKVFGYYIEVTAAHRAKLDSADNAAMFRGWTRKQTLKNAERFITDQLKTFEEKVLTAESRAIAREQQLFDTLCEQAKQRIDALQQFAAAVAELDVLACFAQRAVRMRYVRPTMTDEPVLDIRAGRHPVLDEKLGDQFVPNDVGLGSGVWGLGTENPQPESDQTQAPRPQTQASTLALITGPNMAGKSTYIRQTALIALMAHTGSFVPAEAATVGVCDRIFTRVGANDELHAGQSTFMVEMTETANICHHATPASLVILDEIGRGTSTLDGLSLAWAIAEFLATKQCRCLFATHYHELTQLSEQFDNVANLNVTVREWQDEIVFLHRIVPGATDRSYGIAVAKIAGLPAAVVQRANELLKQLTVSHEGQSTQIKQAIAAPGSLGNETANTPANWRQPAGQLGLFTEYLVHPAIERLHKTNLDALSPLEAFDLLRTLKRELEEK